MEEQSTEHHKRLFLVFNSEEARHAQKNGPPEIIILLLQPHLIVWASGDRLQACSLNRRRSAERARIIILLIPPHLLIKGVHYLSIYLSNYLSTMCLSVYLSICPSI